MTKPQEVRWTTETFAKAKRGREIPEIKRILDLKKIAGPDEKPEALPLSEDVLTALRATGPGWQKRAEAALREKFVTKAA